MLCRFYEMQIFFKISLRYTYQRQSFFNLTEQELWGLVNSDQPPNVACTKYLNFKLSLLPGWFALLKEKKNEASHQLGPKNLNRFPWQHFFF